MYGDRLDWSSSFRLHWHSNVFWSVPKAIIIIPEIALFTFLLVPYRCVAGFGGQVDFIRGAGEGYDGKGKPIIAMASMSPRGVSKIVPVIKEGMVSFSLEVKRKFLQLCNSIN